MADSLADGVGELTMQIHLQRIVGPYVDSARGAGQFCSRAVGGTHALLNVTL